VLDDGEEHTYQYFVSVPVRDESPEPEQLLVMESQSGRRKWALPNERSALLSKQLLTKHREKLVHTSADLGELVRPHRSLVLPSGCIGRAEGRTPFSTCPLHTGQKRGSVTAERIPVQQSWIRNKFQLAYFCDFWLISGIFKVSWL